MGMRYKFIIIFLVLVTVFPGMVPVSANPFDDLKQFEKLSSIQKISGMDSVSMTSGSLNDPFSPTFTQPSSSFSIPPTNPFNTIVPVTNYIEPMPSTTVYDSYLNDQMRQMKYTTDISTSNRLISTYGDKVETDSYNQIMGTFAPSPLEQQQQDLEHNTIDYFEHRWDLTPGTIGIPYSSLKTVYSLADSTYDRVGYSTQILSPPAIDPLKYKTENFGPFGIYGGQTRAIDKIETDHISKVTSDEFYTPGNSISHFYTQKTNFNDFALPYSPGTTISGSRIETSSFYTPLKPGIGGWIDSRLTTNFPTIGYDPATDVGTRNIQQSLKINVQVNPGISNINRPSSIPKIPSFTKY